MPPKDNTNNNEPLNEQAPVQAAMQPPAQPPVQQSTPAQKVPKQKEPFKLTFSNSFGLAAEKDFFLENLSMLFTSGLDIVYTIEAVGEGTKNKIMKQVIDSIKLKVQSGSPLWKAFEETNFLPPQKITLIKMGEESGKLPDNLKIIVEQQQKDRVFKSKLKSAMSYPALILAITLFLGIGISWFILPKLTTIFTSLNLELPLITRIVIRFAEFMEKNGIVAVPIFLLILFTILYIIFAYPKTKHIGQAFLLSFPVLKTLIVQVEIARFGYILGTLLSAGIPITEAFNSLIEATSFRAYKNLYASLRDGVTDGKSIREIFLGYKKLDKLIPYHIQHMIIASEQSGNLQSTLVKVAAIFEEKTEITTKNLSTLLEPIMLLIVFGGVMVVAVAVILPIYSLIGNFGDVSKAPPPIKRTSTAKKKPVEAPPTVRAPVEPTSVKVLETPAGTVSVRSIPSPAGSIIGTVATGEELLFDEKQENWYQITLPTGIQGWVDGESVEEIVVP